MRGLAPYRRAEDRATHGAFAPTPQGSTRHQVALLGIARLKPHVYRRQEPARARASLTAAMYQSARLHGPIQGR
jgi:hypothetical protein